MYCSKSYSHSTSSFSFSFGKISVLLLLFSYFLFNAKYTLANNNNYFIDNEVLDSELIIESINKNDQSFHLFTHGKPGALLIEGEWLENEAIVKYLKPLLKNKSQLNIYACNFAQGEKGLNAVSFLEKQLNVSISASNNITGIDGDWILEVGSSSSAISIPNYNKNLQIGVCNEKQPLVNGSTFSGLTATARYNGVCTGGISYIANVVDADLTNYSNVQGFIDVACTYSVGVRDANTVYNAGTYAGFEVGASSLLSIGVSTDITLRTFLGGIQVESYSVSSSLIGVNTGLLNSNGNATLGFVTSQNFDEIRIEYYSLIGALSAKQVYHAVIQEFCAPTVPLACNDLTPITNPEYPVYINSARTGISSVACVACDIDSLENILSPDTSKYASLNIAVGVGSVGSLSIKNALSTTPANTYVGFEIYNSSLLSLGLLDDITITTYRNDSVQEVVSGHASLLDIGSDLLLTSSKRNIGFVTTKSFDEVQFSLVNTVGLSLGETRIYSFNVQTFCPAVIQCDSTYVLSNPTMPVVLNGLETGINGLVCAACEVSDAQNVLSADTTEFANITLAVGLGSTGTIAIQDALSTYSSGSKVGFTIENLSPLVQLDLFESIQVCTYLDGDLQECFSGSNLLNLNLLNLILVRTNNIYNVGFESSTEFDEVRITLSSLASVLNSINVYNGFVDTEGSSICCFNYSNLTVTTTNPTDCGLTDGSIEFTNLDPASDMVEFTYKKDGVQVPSTTQTISAGTLVISNLGQGVYTDFNFTRSSDPSCVYNTPRTVYLFDPSNCAVTSCNTKEPLVNNSVFNGLVAGVNTSGICIGGASNLPNLVDSNLNNFVSIGSLLDVACSYELEVRDINTVYSAGTFAGFEVSASGLLNVNIAATVDISTYLNGTLVETYPAVTSLIGVNSALVNANGNVTLGFVTSQNFNEVRIKYTSLVGLLQTYQIYHAVIQEFCPPTTPLACNELTPITNPEYPVYFNSSRSGINGLACVGCTLDSLENILDADTNKYASMNLTLGVGSIGSVSIKNALSSTSANTYVGFEIETPSTLNLSVLDDITITTYLNDTVQEVVSGQASLLEIGSDILLTTTRRNIGFVTSEAFDEVQFSIVNTVGVSLGETRIYSFNVQTFCPAVIECDSLYNLTAPSMPVVVNGLETGIDGLVCTACVVSNAQNVLSADTTEFANIALPVGVASTGTIAVQDALSTYPIGSSVGFTIENLNPLLLQLDLFESIEICTYLDGNLQECYSGSQLLNLNLLGPILGRTTGIYNVGFVSSAEFDEVRITLSSLVSALNSINIFNSFVDTRGAIDCCEITDAGIIDITCNDNGTPQDDTDDYIDFTVQPIGGTTNGTYTITYLNKVEVASFDSVVVFSTDPGTAGQGSFLIDIKSNTDTTCGIQATVTDPGTCFSCVAYSLNSLIKTDATSCNTNDGTIRILGLEPNTTYQIHYQLDSVNGANSGLSYLSNSGGELMLSNLPAGSYTDIYAVNNLTSCISDTLLGPVTILSPDAPVITGVVNLVNPTSCVTCNGSFRLTGLLPNTVYNVAYELDSIPQAQNGVSSNSAGNITLLNLCDGSYDNITVVNVNTACISATATGGPFVLTNPNSNPILTTTLLNPLSCGLSNGSIAIDGLEVTLSYTYTYDKNGISQGPFTQNSNGSGVLIISNLSAGLYENINLISNTTSCSIPTLVGPYVLTDSSNINIDSVEIASNASACGVCDGQIILRGDSLLANTAYTISYSLNNLLQTPLTIISGADSSVVLPNLCKGTYGNISLSNSSNCSSPVVVGPFEITEPNSPIVISITVNNVTNCGYTDGQLLIELDPAQLGQSPYTVNYTFAGNLVTLNGQVADVNNVITISGLSSGIYSNISLEDNSTCTSIMNSGPYTINEPPRLLFDSVVNVIDVTNCSSSPDGVIELGYFLPFTNYQVSYNYNNISQSVNVSSAGDSIISIQNLAAGNYTNIVIQNLTTLCISNQAAGGPFTINNPMMPTIDTSNFTNVNPSVCGTNDGSIIIDGLLPNTSYSLEYFFNGLAATPYSNFTNALGEFVLPNLTEGFYSNFRFRDDVTLCYTNVVNQVVELEFPDFPVTVFASTDPTGCGAIDGTITFTGLPANESFVTNYLFNGVAQAPVLVTANNVGNVVFNGFTGLPAGSYTNFTFTGSPISCNSMTLADTITLNSTNIILGDAGNNDTICIGESYTLTAGILFNDVNVTWRLNSSTGIIVNPTNPISFTQTVTPSSSGWYFAEFNRTSTGCTYYDSVYILVNQAPILVLEPNCFDLDEDTSITLSILNDIYANDDMSNVYGNGTLNDMLDISIVSNVSNGTITINENLDQIVYTPNPDFNGFDTLYYQVCNNNCSSSSNCDEAYICFNVNPVNDAPIAVDDVFTTLQNNDVDGDVSINDSDVDGDVLIFNGPIDEPSNGTITFNTDGTFTYTPDQNFIGMDSFTYVVCDAILCDTATVTIVVREDRSIVVNANDDVMTTPWVPTMDVDVLGNDSHSEGATVTILVNPFNGRANVVDNFVVYSPFETGENYTDSIQYQLCVGSICDTAWIFIEIITPIKVPNGFSPQGDGVNDLFVIDNLLKLYPEASLGVFNRWGDEVWNSRGPYINNWGGTNFQGENLPDGTYFYIIEFNDGETKPQQGFVAFYRKR